MKGFFVCLFAMLTTSVFANNLELIGGRVADQGEHPEIIYIRSGHSYCSATVIGEEVILTAAHCVQDMGEIGPTGFDYVDFVFEKEIYTARCKQAPLYKSKKEDHDFALCKTDHVLAVQPAKISKKGPALDEVVMLSGYGCTDSNGNGGNDGKLRIGEAKVTQLPKGKDHWYRTEDASALCYGDSGGPSMIGDGSSKEVIGVNSRGDIHRLSLLTALYTRESIQFLEKFALEQKVEICGITEDC